MSEAKQLFKNINIIGLGLIGGSLAQACKQHKIAEFIFGFDIDKNQTDLALKRQIIDGIFDFKHKAFAEDLIIICTPLFKYEQVFQQISAITEDQTLIIDAGSLKYFTLQLAEKILQKKAKNFIACHPIAGSEKSGFVSSEGDLFIGKKAIITPSKINDPNQIKKAQLFWQKIGSKVEFSDSEEHDRIFSLISHLPQLLAFIAKEEFENGDDKIINKHFRLQNSNPKMWQEIFSLNHKNLEHYLKFYLRNLDDLIAKIRNNELENYLLRNGISLTKKANINIIKRILLVICFLNLPDIKNFQDHSGKGFEDFTALISHQDFLPNNFSTIKTSEDDKSILIKFLNQVKSSINKASF